MKSNSQKRREIIVELERSCRDSISGTASKYKLTDKVEVDRLCLDVADALMSWRGIASAPTNGTKILAFEAPRTFEAVWRKDTPDAPGRWYKDGWVPCNPTHWRPLLPRPKNIS